MADCPREAPVEQEAGATVELNYTGHEADKVLFVYVWMDAHPSCNAPIKDMTFTHTATLKKAHVFAPAGLRRVDNMRLYFAVVDREDVILPT